MDNQLLHVDDYIILDEIISLYLNIIFESNKVELSILLPTYYPKTEIGTSSIIKNKGLFYALIEIQSPSLFWKKYVPRNTQTLLKLVFFYSYVREHHIKMIKDEKQMIVGLGKKIICLSFPYIINYYNIHTSLTSIVLIASGGKIKTKEDYIKFNHYSQLDNDDILSIYKNAFPEDFDKKYDKLINQTSVENAIDLINIENNEKLINYYKYAFGFHQLSPTSNNTLMQTQLSTLIRQCQY